MPTYNTIEDLDIVLQSANNISLVSFNGEKWKIEYKNGLSTDEFNSCSEMMDFLIHDGDD